MENPLKKGPGVNLSFTVAGREITNMSLELIVTCSLFCSWVRNRTNLAFYTVSPPTVAVYCDNVVRNVGCHSKSAELLLLVKTRGDTMRASSNQRLLACCVALRPCHLLLSPSATTQSKSNKKQLLVME